MKKQKTIASITIKSKGNQSYDIPQKGSLGLLALGHIGLLAWRKKRDAVKPIDSDKKTS